MTTELSARMSAAIGARMPAHLQRLRWSPAQLADFQRDRLRALLARAIERSPFHAARLRDLDPARPGSSWATCLACRS
jgi:phenylacetate-CoA ligase